MATVIDNYCKCGTNIGKSLWGFCSKCLPKEAPRAVELLDTLRRIDIAYRAMNLKCNCKSLGEGDACDICEITYLLDEVAEHFGREEQT